MHEFIFSCVDSIDEGGVMRSNLACAPRSTGGGDWGNCRGPNHPQSHISPF